VEFASPDRVDRQWSVGESYGGDFMFCLYVRDRFGLRPSTEPHLPPLLPAVQARSSTPRRATLEAQWDQWWRFLFAAREEGVRRQLGETADALPELDQALELQEAARSVSSDGHAWVDARKREFIDLSRHNRRLEPSMQAVVAGRAASYPFSPTVTCLPVDAKTGWRLGREHVVVSFRLYEDRASYMAYMGDVVARLTR
jgi:hypothetical protein